VRLGLFGGSFDPPHVGHLSVAEQAREALALDRVLFVPAPRPPHKPDAHLSAVADRLEMVRAAIAGNPAFAASDAESGRPGPSFTAETLAALAGAHPAAELFCLVGSDTAVALHTWHDRPRLFAMATFAVLLRPGWPEARLAAWLEAQPAALRPRLAVVRVPGLDISATEVRARVAAGRSIRYLVPDAVAAIIASRGLYREEAVARDGT
jgi:nicotinate-nucleotide adenylyltransferase